MNSIFKRTSIRYYKDQVVEKEKVDIILKAAMASPTAGNQQEWEFVVVTDKKVLHELAKTSPYSGCVMQAPLAIVVVANKDIMKFPDHWQQDLGACCENIWLEAVEQDLGAVWLGVAPEEERMNNVKGDLHLPDHIDAFAIMAIGYPQDPLPPKNNYDERKIHYQTW